MSLQPRPPFSLDLQSTLGAWFIGAIASVGLLGVVSLQCWTYFIRFPDDHRFIKILVLAVWALEFLKAATSVHAGYFLAVVKWGDVLALLRPIWSMKVMVVLANTVIFLVHLFFAHKVWLLTRRRHWWIPTIIMIFSVADFALGMATFAATLINASYQELIFGKAGHFATAGLGCAVIADWTITASLVVFLRAEQGSHYKSVGKTKNFVGRLIFYTINIGLLVSMADLVVLILLNVKFKALNLYQLMAYEIVGNLYANTLLACLNMRLATSSLEVSEIPKAQNYTSSSDRTLTTTRGTGTSRPSSIGHGHSGQDKSATELIANEYKSTWLETAQDRKTTRLIKRPEIVVTKSTVTMNV